MNRYMEMAEFFATMLCCLGTAWAASRFCKAALELSRKETLLFTVSFFAGDVLINSLPRLCPMPYLVLALGSHLYLIGILLLLSKEPLEKKLLAGSMLTATLTLAGSFFDSLFSLLALLFLHTAGGIPEPFLSEREMFLLFCLQSAALVVLLHRMADCRVFAPGNLLPCSAVSYGLKGQHFLPSLFLLAVALITDTANWGASNGILINGGEMMSLYHNLLFGHAEICVLTALSMLAAYFYVSETGRISMEQRKRSRYDAQIAAYRLLEEQHKKSERLRHDMKNHIIALSGLLKGKEYEKLGDYLKRMEESESLAAGLDATGSQAVDALLCQKRQRAEDLHVAWECDVRLPQPCRIDEFDFCVLFGNLLDNALEACGRLPDGKRRFLHLQARAVKKCFLLEIQNSTAETSPPKDGATSKENPKEHGIGLQNVCDVVQGYHGTMSIEVKDGCFIVSVLLPF